MLSEPLSSLDSVNLACEIFIVGGLARGLCQLIFQKNYPALEIVNLFHEILNEKFFILGFFS
jgi:hypothetical protein